jgi:radical SAM protein with 4Fe4S-binding SPASM domain
MIDITKLYCHRNTLADGLRYGEEGKNHPHRFKQQKKASERRPVVVWNITRRCNLQCIHCYSDSKNINYPDELTTDQAMAVIDDLAALQVPAILFSGGEPLYRKDLFQLTDYARQKGLRFVLSTNGTLINQHTAEKIKQAGFSYVGISLDGIGPINDQFRGQKGSFDLTMAAFKNLKALQQRVGLRMTLTRHNINNLEDIFDFIEAENIDRACFYHLAYSGRGHQSIDISKEDTRNALDIILKRTRDFHNRNLPIDILTVDNHVDGIYLYLKLLKENPAKAQQTYKMLCWNGGGLYSSGVGIGAIDPEGNVHPDQFWQHYNLGNVKNRKFSDIWFDSSDPLMKGLKDRQTYIKGKCAHCKWFEACGGSLRVRADKFYNDPWQEDPACYLKDNEISS